MINFRILVAGVCAGLLSNITGYVITARLFHRFQAMTPNTWRTAESWTHYIWAAAIRISACIAIACVFATFWDRSPPLGGGVLTRGISFGALLWAALILPLVLEAALFVQWHRGFVIGLLLDWLVLCVLASLAAAYSVRAQLEDNPARWEVKVLEGGARCRLREESILCIDVSQYLSQVYHVALGAQI